MIRIGVYSRVSSVGQLEGHSLATQSDRSDATARRLAGNEDYEIILYEERALSGVLPPAQLSTEEGEEFRPVLTRLLEDAEKGLLDWILFSAVDRLARDPAVFYAVEKRLQKLGIPYRFLDVDVDPSSDTGAAMIGVLQLFASMWLKQHRRRITDAWHKRLEEGYPPGGRPPYGWQWQDHAAVAPGGRRGYLRDTDQAHWALWMKERYLTGWTTTRIAEELRKRGVPRPCGQNCHWDSSAVRKVLVHHINAGLVRQPDGSVKPGAHWEQRLWPPEERELICKRLKRNRKLGAMTIANSHYPLAGIITCGHCGQRLYGALSQSTGKRLYQCHTRVRKGKWSCPGVGRLAEPLEQAVMETIRQLSAAEEVRNLALEETLALLEKEKEHLTEYLAQLQRQRGDIQQRIDRLTDMRAGGELTAQEFLEHKNRLSEQRQQVNQHLAQVEAQIDNQSTRRVELEAIRNTLQNFEAIWQALDPDEQQEALRDVIEYAKLERAEGEDLILRLKVAFLPERTIPMPSYIKRKAARGPDSLTPRLLAYLKHRQQELDDSAIASVFDTNLSSVRRMARQIKNRLQVDTVAEAMPLAAERLEREAHALPMIGRLKKRVPNQPKFRWTRRRRQILAAAATGKLHKDLAASLGITPKTFSEHLRQMKKYAGVKTLNELLAYAAEKGLLDETCKEEERSK